MNVLQNTLAGLKNRMINDEITVQNSSGDDVTVTSYLILQLWRKTFNVSWKLILLRPKDKLSLLVAK